MKPSFAWLLSLLTGFSAPVFAQADISDKYWQKAEQLAIEGKSRQSLKFYEKAFDVIKYIDPSRAANLCNDMSSAHYSLDHFDISINYCRQGLSHLRNMRDPPDSLYFKLFSSLATMHSALKHADSSSYYFLAADDVLDKNAQVEKQIPQYVLYHYLHQGRAFWTLHRYHQSLAYFLKAKQISEHYNLPDELAYIDSSIAEAYDLLGEHKEALKYRLLASKYSVKDPKWQQGFYTGIGYTYQRLNVLDSALFWQQKSWKLHLTQPKNTQYYKRQHVELLYLIANLYRKKDELSEAQQYLTQAEKYRQKDFPKDLLMKSLLLVEKGAIASARQQLSQAESYFLAGFHAVILASRKTDISAVDLIYPQAGLQALLLYASTLVKHYNATKNPSYLHASFKAYSKLINLKQSVYLDAAQEPEERHLISGESVDVFKEAIPAAYAFYKMRPSATVLQEIFSWFEQANATYLYDIIKVKQIQLQRLSPAILAEEQRLLQKRALLARSEESSSGAVKKEVEDLRIQWYKLRQKIKKQYPSAYNEKDSVIHFTSVQRHLGKESAFVSYKWFNGYLYAFVVTSDVAQLVSWPVNDGKLRSNLADLYAQINSNPGFGKYKGTLPAIGCHNLLFEPVKKLIASRKRIVIARDWQFNFLPFDVLESGSKTNDYLAKNFAFTYSYSASFFWQHPFKSTDNAMSNLTIAPFVKEQILPDTIWHPIAKLADIRDIGGEILWGSQATKQRLLQSGLHYNVLQFATHAHAADDNPNDSFIQLFPGIDSRLYLNEIYNLPLHSTRLVVLTACSGGSGKNLRGEGNISLAHAIAQAGCPSVVTTNWEANDLVSGYLSVRLYKYLHDGYAIDLALQNAKIDFFKNDAFKQYAHPYYWANLTLLGNNEPVYETPAFSGMLGSIVVLIVLGLAGITLFKKKPYQRRYGD